MIAARDGSEQLTKPAAIRHDECECEQKADASAMNTLQNRVTEQGKTLSKQGFFNATE
ncbi:hypothetical protein [Klebsiella michiganensis]